MNKEKRTMLKQATKLIGPVLILLAVMLLLGGAPAQAKTETAMVSRPETAIVAPPVSSTNNSVGAAPAAAIHNITLCATTGSAGMPDGSIVPIWGYVEGDCGIVSGTAALPGHIIEVTAGDTVNITLENDLPEPVSILFPGQAEPPDMIGAAASGGTTTYSFVANNPGTYLYESGTNSGIQVPMGLYGALIVHSTTANQAYSDANSAYDEEAVLVLSEIDPAFNANPAGFNMLDFAPTYWLINGKPYEPTDPPVLADPGDKVLVRYLNPGSVHHTMTALGADQTIVAIDGYPVPYPYTIVAQTIPSGQTTDAIVEVPTDAAGSRIALYNRNLHLTNGGLGPDHYDGGGGMMTFIQTGLNFNDYTVMSYGAGQDACGGGASVEDNGATLHLVGNCWKKIGFSYPVTHTISASTVIEFDFKSTAEGEIHGIGFDDDDIISNPIRVFKLYGTQTWGIDDFDDYGTSAPGWKHYKIPVGQFYTGSMDYLTFTNDHDVAGPTAESYFRNIHIYDEVPPTLLVNGSNYLVESYGGAQDANASVSIEDGGATLRITGNGWKKVAISYPVVAATVLEFDFESSAMGEIHGIGLDTDNAIGSSQTFELYGTQTWGIQTYHNYVSGSVHYVIPIGTLPQFLGTMDYLTFTNDHDVASPTAESVFSNISIHE